MSLVYTKLLFTNREAQVVAIVWKLNCQLQVRRPQSFQSLIWGFLFLLPFLFLVISFFFLLFGTNYFQRS